MLKRSQLLPLSLLVLCLIGSATSTSTSNQFVRGVLDGLQRESNFEILSSADNAQMDLFVSAISQIENGSFGEATEAMNHFLTILMMEYKSEENKKSIFEIVLTADRVFLNKNFFSDLAAKRSFADLSLPLLRMSKTMAIQNQNLESGQFFGQFLQATLNSNQSPNFNLAKAMASNTSPYDEFVQDVFRGLYDGFGYAKNENIFKLITMNNFNINDYIDSISQLASSSTDDIKNGASMLYATFNKTQNSMSNAANDDQNFRNVFETIRLDTSVNVFFVRRMDTYRIRTGFDAHYFLILASDSNDMGQYYSSGLYLARALQKLKSVTHLEDFNWPLLSQK